jgi:hypothetical protein
MTSPQLPPPPPYGSPGKGNPPWLVIVLVLIVVVPLLGSVGLGMLYPIAMMRNHSSASADEDLVGGVVVRSERGDLCVQDRSDGVTCLARSVVRITNPSSEIPDADAVRTGVCLWFSERRPDPVMVDVTVRDCDSSESIRYLSSTTTTR